MEAFHLDELVKQKSSSQNYDKVLENRLILKPGLNVL